MERGGGGYQRKRLGSHTSTHKWLWGNTSRPNSTQTLATSNLNLVEVAEEKKGFIPPNGSLTKKSVSNMQRWPHSTYLFNPEWLNGSCVGTVAYLLWPTVYRPEVRLVAAKVRVALLRHTTIPRLELMASLVASWLAQIICDEFKSLSLCQLLFGQIPGSFYIGWTLSQSRLSPLWEFVLPRYSLPGTPSTGDLFQQTLTLLTTLAKASL